MYTETEEWTNEQPDGGVVYGITVRLYEDDGTYLGAHSRHWHLDVSPPTREEVETTKRRAVQHVNERAEEMRGRAQALREKGRRREQRRQQAQDALAQLSSTAQ